MTLRARLALAFAAFATLPLAAAMIPVSRALGEALSAEHAARVERAALAVEGELARQASATEAAVAEIAAAADAEAVARDLASGALAPSEARDVAAGWAAERGLDVLEIVDAEGRVISSAHLPGRAGDVDPDAVRIAGAVTAGKATAVVVPRAGEAGVTAVLAQVAWAPLGAAEGGLRVLGGLALGEDRAARLAELTGGEIRVTPGDVPAPATPAAAPGSRLRSLLGGPALLSRIVKVGSPGAVAGAVEIRVGSAGLVRAQLLVLGAFALVLLAGAAGAGLAGAALARRITRPIEALRAAAARVAGGELGARVGVQADGEVGELVRAFDAMSADLALGRARLAQAERVAAWREVARRLAHEIKNPLTPIAMSVETLRDARAAGRPDFGEIFDESTRAIGEEVRRLKRIVDEFGRFARLPPPERAPVAPEELAASVLALFPSPPAGVELRREVEPGLPRVMADRDQILQVLLNLVSNAFDAMAASGGVLTLGARRDGDAVAITVRDTGPGIAPDDRTRLFEPYFTTKPGGTGLGLAIARRIAEEHGGTLDLEGVSGGGATFVLVLPAAGPDVEARSAAGPGSRASGPASP